MFVRWKRRKKTYKWPRRYEHKGEVYLSAYLVENKRVDGKVKQRVVKYLGSIHETKVNVYGYAVRFWESANRALAKLGFEESELQGIRNKLAETVMPITAEAKAEAERQFAASMAQFRHTFRAG